MNETVCWMCEKPFKYTGEKYQDIKCPNCGVECSVYDKSQATSNEAVEIDPFDLITDNEPQNEEEGMPFEKQEKNFLSLPKVGQEYDFSQHGKITEIKKVEGQKGFNFVKKESLILPDGTTAKIDKDLGYHYAIRFEDGKILTVSSWKPYYAMDRAGLIEGCKFQLKHLVKGEWECILI